MLYFFLIVDGYARNMELGVPACMSLLRLKYSSMYLAEKHCLFDLVWLKNTVPTELLGEKNTVPAEKEAEQAIFKISERSQ